MDSCTKANLSQRGGDKERKSRGKQKIPKTNDSTSNNQHNLAVKALVQEFTNDWGDDCIDSSINYEQQTCLWNSLIRDKDTYKRVFQKFFLENNFA